MNRAAEALPGFVLGSHSRTTCAKMGVVVNSIEKIGSARNFACYSEKSSHDVET